MDLRRTDGAKVGRLDVPRFFMGSCSLHDLGRKLGTDAMAQFIHDYAVEHALGFSTTNAFKSEAQAVADGLPHPIDLTRFWKKHRIDNVP